MFERAFGSLATAVVALSRRPRFAIGATALLSGTLFAVAMVFTLLNAVLVRPLPFAESENLVAVRATVQRETRERRAFSRPDFVDYHQQIHSVTALGAYNSFSATLGGAGAARVTPGELIDASYLEVLGVAPATGRGFIATQPRESTVLISNALWHERFDARPDAIGRSISVDGRPFTVIGVMPPGFAGVTGIADIWLPFDAPGLMSEGLADARASRWHEAIARLAAGTQLSTLNEELDAIGARLATQYPASNTGYSAQAVPLREELLGEQGAAIEAAAAGVGLLLLITILNLGGLALVRASSRSLEHAMRRCLGASPSRLFADTCAEGVVIGLLSGTIAGALALLVLTKLTQLLPIELPGFVSVTVTPGIAFAVLLAGVLGGFAAFVLGGLIARRAQLVTLRAGARSTRQHAGLRRALVGGEIALGVALVAAALLLARSFAAVSSVDPGYRVDDAVVMDFELPEVRYDTGAALAFGRRLVQLAQETPGVQRAALASDSPLGNDWSASILTSDRLENIPTRAYRHGVSSDFFETTGIAFEAGATFPETTAAGDEPLVIVSAALARRMWPGEHAIGRRVKRGPADSTAPWMRVVGVVEDARWRGLPFGPTADPDFLQPLTQAPETTFSLILQTRDEPLATARRVAERLRSLDAEVPVYAVESMRERVRAATQIPRFLAALGLVFSAVALLLSALGVYAIAALDASQRVRELAIRQAVGADLAALARLFAGEYGRIFGLAIVAGLVALIPLAQILESRLYGVALADPWSIVGSALLFAAALAVGLTAPLRRVLGVQPAELMRGE